MSFSTVDTTELIGLGTKFEMGIIQGLNLLDKNPKMVLDYLSEEYDSLLRGPSIAPKLLTRHANRIGYWYFDLRENERRFAPEGEIDLQENWGKIRDFYKGAFFGKENGSLITVSYEILYSQEGGLRPAIWRYVTGRVLLKNDLERLGLSAD